MVLVATASCSKKEKLDLANAAPFENLYSDQDIKDKFINLKAKPYNRDDMAFSILVPKDWRDVPQKVSPELYNNPTETFLPLSEQLAPEGADGHPRIEVRFHELDLVTRLDNWVSYFIEVTGYELLLRRLGNYNNRTVEDVLARVNQNGVNHIVRMTFSKHGKRIFLVACSCEEGYFNPYAKIFGTAAVSFTVAQESESDFAETMKEVSLPGPPAIKFRYPDSWSRKDIEDVPAGKYATDLALRLNEKTVGFIHIKGISKALNEFPDLILTNLRKDFKDAGVGFIAKTNVADLAPKLPEPLGKVEVWDATVDGVPATVSTMIMHNNDGYVALGLLVPDKEKNPFAWITSWRVFEIVMMDVNRSLSANR